MQAVVSWVEGADGSPYGLQNLPYGAYVVAAADHPGAGTEARVPRLGVRIGDKVLDLGAAARTRNHPDAKVLSRPSLNAFMAGGPPAWHRVREALVTWLSVPDLRPEVEPHLVPLEEVSMLLPFEVADYVDFYASEQHATNVGRIFRPESPSLPSSWRHLPIGYHGRSGTVCVSGTPVLRPSGQRRPPTGGGAVAGRATGGGAGGVPPGPVFGPCGELDFEAEVGFVVGAGSTLGEPVALGQWRRHVFGVVLVNDWSARDIQSFEYVPLGPFLGKSFLTSVSSWVVPIDALDEAATAPPPRDPPLLSHLDDSSEPPAGLDIRLEVSLNGEVISRPPFATMYWTAAQQVTHMTSNGASLRTGDLFASGTVSGQAATQWGSLLELAWRGEHPIELGEGERRSFLEDGDTLVITATAPGPDGTTIGFGEVAGTVVAA
ncbi:MAG: fumarylacetoacetase [Acidimicrobiales bacterium]